MVVDFSSVVVLSIIPVLVISFGCFFVCIECDGKIVAKWNDTDVVATPKRRSSGSVEYTHERATRLMLVGIALKNKDQFKNVVRSVREDPGVLAGVAGLLQDTGCYEEFEVVSSTQVRTLAEDKHITSVGKLYLVDLQQILSRSEPGALSAVNSCNRWRLVGLWMRDSERLWGPDVLHRLIRNATVV